jgi:RNA polymerase sigma factor (sigma-70 family)
MNNKNKHTVSVDYELADGESILVEITPEVARSLRSDARRERTRQRNDRRFLDAGGYIEGETELLLQDLDESVVERVEYRQRKKMVKDAVKDLPPRQRQFVCDYYFRCLTMQDIANKEHISKQAVSHILQKARINMKRIIIRNSRFYGTHQDFFK